ncbi:Ubiquitin-conjugating enzyme E2 J1 [Sphaceloma murrayae]|uniref:Ubiquitin-conjugating enzyme E2 J1 n=1 Tax=Sphaceloma murrayae TaxID=2082308 RepID=A0A2K1QHA0_9PEZI|nr:Ubiquitin-conjugating enzyme E2 J1 [Sphaceloma murrayae]
MNVPPNTNPPWSSAEKLDLLTEIIKAQNLSPDVLLPIVRQLAEPKWDDLVLPRGRTLNQCRATYNEYVRPGNLIGLSRSSSVREAPRPLDMSVMNRPFSMEGPSSAPVTGGRYQDIQPKPAGLGSILNPQPQKEPPKKKRGRPTKEEASARREAQRRAESFPAARRDTLVTAGPSTGPSMIAQQAAQAVMTPPLQNQPKPTAPQETSSGKRKRLKVTKGEHEPQSTTEMDVDVLEPHPYGMQHARTPSRGYPDILTRQPDEGPSTFRAPRGGE